MNTVVRKGGGENERPSGAVLNRTFGLLIICGIIAFGALGVKLFSLQVVRHDEFESKAINQQTRDSVVKAARGTIFDRNGKTLAFSATAEMVNIDPRLMKENNENASDISDALSVLLGIDRDEIYAKTQRDSGGISIKRKVEAEEARAVREYIAENRIRSVYFEPDAKRYYPQSSLAASVIGFVGVDHYGLEGIEAKYDSYLTGVDGRIVRLRNVAGTDMMFTDYENYYNAENGGDITLTIDSTIQYYTEKNLAQSIEDFGIRDGALAIVADPNNMEILAMATMGSFDLNAPFDVSDAVRAALDEIAPEERASGMSTALTSQWRNRAIADTYEPGSVFKAITLAIALEEGLVDEHSTFYCGGELPGVPGRPADNPYHCWKRVPGHGTQTLSEAVENSCNVAFVNIGLRIGAETFYKYIEEFGFKDKTGFDLPGEAVGKWWPDASFMNPRDKTSLASASFGQTFTITPLQLVTAISASVNGGYIYTPHVVQTIKDPAGNIVKSASTEPVRQVVSESTSAVVRQILENVVSVGTGANAQVAGYRVGGKTGTSTDTVREAETAEKEYIVSFCGVAPMDNPQVVVLVLLKNPPPQSETGVYVSGGAMAAPTVGNILADILPYLGILPQYTEEEERQLNVTVPRLVESPDEAKAQLEKLGLGVKIVGSGDKVTGQMPAANAIVSPGTKVIIYMGAEVPSTNTVVVPSLTAKGYYEVKNALEALGLFVRSTGVPAGLSSAAVAVQSIPAGTEVAYGTVIEVTLVDTNIQGLY